MKRKIIMLVLAALIVLSFVGTGCGVKENRGEAITPTPEMIEEDELDDESGEEDLRELESILPDPRSFFESNDIQKDSYINFEGDATVIYLIYEDWTSDEINAYKEAITDSGFTDINYEFDSSFSARSEDGKWYFSMSEDVDQGRAVYVISASRDS